MLFALDKNGNKTYIDNIKTNQEYFCPCCNSKMISKIGKIKTHHFAHHSENICSDSWHYDMTQWHYDWQSKFPIDCQEIVKKLGEEKHRADILLEKEKVVFEFQHSVLSPEEFQDRNQFYNKLGYKIIWIFDAIEPFHNNQIQTIKENIWSWSKPRKTFDNFNFKNKNVEIYLQLEEDYLIRATWCPEHKGLSIFASDGTEYTDNNVVHIFDTKDEEVSEELKLSSLYDELIELYSRDHTRYYFGCPISNTHMCADQSIDIPQNKYEDIKPCMYCEFRDKTTGRQICQKRFLDLNLSINTPVHIENRNEYGFINKISYIINGTKEFLEIPTIKPDIFKSIFDLWDDSYSRAIFKNIKTNKYVKLIQNPKEQYAKYGHVYGYLSSNEYSFPGKSCDLYYIFNPEWFYIWSDKK